MVVNNNNFLSKEPLHLPLILKIILLAQEDREARIYLPIAAVCYQKQVCILHNILQNWKLQLYWAYMFCAFNVFMAYPTSYLYYDMFCILQFSPKIYGMQIKFTLLYSVVIFN
jgi:hypothetical protein